MRLRPRISVERDRVLHLRQRVALELADAVLGRDRAVILQHDLVDHVVDLAPAREEAPLSAPTGWLTLKCILPSPTWPNGTGRQPGMMRFDGGARFCEECRHRGDRHRHVVLDRAAFRLLHFGQRVAQVPERLCLVEARRDRRVLDQTLRDRIGEQLLDAVAQAVARAATRLPSARTRDACVASGSRMPWPCLSANSTTSRDHQLEAGDRAADARLRQVEQLHRGGRRGHADEGGLHRARARKQLEHRGGDDAERAFGADEDVAQVVAGVVLLQLATADS